MCSVQMQLYYKLATRLSMQQGGHKIATRYSQDCNKVFTRLQQGVHKNVSNPKLLPLCYKVITTL